MKLKVLVQLAKGNDFTAVALDIARGCTAFVALVFWFLIVKEGARQIRSFILWVILWVVCLYMLSKNIRIRMRERVERAGGSVHTNTGCR